MGKLLLLVVSIAVLYGILLREKLAP